MPPKSGAADISDLIRSRSPDSAPSGGRSTSSQWHGWCCGSGRNAAKSLAVRLAQGSDGRDKSTCSRRHLQAKTVPLIYPISVSGAVIDRRGLGIGFRRRKISRIPRPGESRPARRSGRRDLKPARKAALSRMSATMSFGPRCSWSTRLPFGSQLANLLGSSPVQPLQEPFPVEIDRLPLQLAYLEFHAMSLRADRGASMRSGTLGPRKDPPAAALKWGLRDNKRFICRAENMTANTESSFRSTAQIAWRRKTMRRA